MRWALRLTGDADGALCVLCVVRDQRGPLARRPARGVGRELGGRVGARRRRRGRRGRGPCRSRWAASCRRNGPSSPSGCQVEALLATPGDMTMLIGQAWLAPGAEVIRDHEHDAHAWWPPDPDEWPEESHPQLRRMASLLVTEPVSFRTLKYLSFAHSAIYTALLVIAVAECWTVRSTCSGWAHGIGWIVMSLLCVDAVRRRVIPLWLGVMVAVVGGVGPFAGSIGFVYAERRAKLRLQPSLNAIWSRTLIWQ